MVADYKALREEAWGVQNRISGRAGISGKHLEIPEDVKSGIYQLASEQLQLCSDAEKGYIAPDDFDDRISKVSTKLKALSFRLENLPAVQPVVTKRAVIRDPRCTYQLEEKDSTSEKLSEALSRIVPGIESLDVAGLNLTDADISEVIDVVRNTAQGKLRVWDLSGNNIHDVGAQRIAAFLASACPSLTWLNLKNNPIGTAGKSALISGLKIIRKGLDVEC